VTVRREPDDELSHLFDTRGIVEALLSSRGLLEVISLEMVPQPDEKNDNGRKQRKPK
jgi:hypothetical protein